MPPSLQALASVKEREVVRKRALRLRN